MDMKLKNVGAGDQNYDKTKMFEQKRTNGRFKIRNMSQFKEEPSEASTTLNTP